MHKVFNGLGAAAAYQFGNQLTYDWNCVIFRQLHVCFAGDATIISTHTWHGLTQLTGIQTRFSSTGLLSHSRRSRGTTQLHELIIYSSE
jgi:hypothetical protein